MRAVKVYKTALASNWIMLQAVDRKGGILSTTITNRDTGAVVVSWKGVPNGAQIHEFVMRNGR